MTCQEELYRLTLTLTSTPRHPGAKRLPPSLANGQETSEQLTVRKEAILFTTGTETTLFYISYCLRRRRTE